MTLIVSVLHAKFWQDMSYGLGYILSYLNLKMYLYLSGKLKEFLIV